MVPLSSIVAQMLMGMDLGFSSLGVVVVLLLAQVIGTIVLRRKWRQEVAKREEGKRFLAFASQEEARVEFEGASACRYSYVYQYNSASEPATTEPVSQRVQYQCAVCLFPTTTRCARCKSVRYCSGKCQIIHWREGHKEECHPFTNNHQIKEVVGSSKKVTKQQEYKIEGENLLSDSISCAKPVETFSEEPLVSNYFHSDVAKKKNENGFKCLVKGIAASSTSKSNKSSFSVGISASCTSTYSSKDFPTNNSDHSQRSDECVQANAISYKVLANGADMVGTRSLASAEATLDNFVDRRSGDCAKTKAGSIDGNTFIGSSSPSALIVDDSRLPMSEPHTVASGFCERTIDPTRLQNATLDDNAHSTCSRVVDGDISNSQSSFSLDLTKDTSLSTNIKCSSAKVVISDNVHPIAAGIEKQRDALSAKLSRDAKKHEKEPSLSSKISRNMNADCNNSRPLKHGEVKHSASSVPCAHPTASDVGRPSSKGVVKDCSLRSLSNEGSHDVINDSNSALHPQKSRDVVSRSLIFCDAHSSSRNETHSVSRGKFTVNEVERPALRASQVGCCSVNSRDVVKTSVCKVDSFGASKLSPPCSFRAKNDAIGRYNCKELFSYELFVKLYNWNKFELRPCGLMNCGNSCYANAVLQCLVFSPPLTAYFIQGFHSKACEKKEWCFTCELESLVLKAKEGNSPLSPIQILSQIPNSGCQLYNGREEDAHEFLSYAIDTMQAVCLKEAGVRAPGIVEEETTLMSLTFGGYLRSKVRCLKCGGKSERHERMMDLTVEIEGDMGTLEEALHQFTNTEILDGENKYHCSRCKSHEKAKKKLTILEAPNVLTIALKRFQSGKFGKLNKSIRFPEILDIAPFMSRASDKSPIYRLYGVVVHLDVMNAAFTGHYVCYVRNIQNKWFKIDDSVVKAVELRTVLEETAYMLLYSRCSPRAPKLTRNPMILRDPRNAGNSIYKPISHQSGPCDVWLPDYLNCQTAPECFTNNHASFLPTKSNLEEDALSDNSSSLFSESCSGSTDSSNRDSTSTEDNFDQTVGDLGHNWNSPWRSSSDSDTSSSSSPLPMYSRCSQISNSDPYFSRDSYTSASKIADEESDMDSQGFWGRATHKNSKIEILEREGSLHSNSTKRCRGLASNGCCRETNSNRLEQSNPFDHLKSGVCFRRSTRERTD